MLINVKNRVLCFESFLLTLSFTTYLTILFINCCLFLYRINSTSWDKIVWHVFNARLNIANYWLLMKNSWLICVFYTNWIVDCERFVQNSIDFLTKWTSCCVIILLNYLLLKILRCILILDILIRNCWLRKRFIEHSINSFFSQDQWDRMKIRALLDNLEKRWSKCETNQYLWLIDNFFKLDQEND